MAVSMEKIEKEAPGLVSLAKKSQGMVQEFGLKGLSARVALCIDYSGSMSHLYSSGAVQAAAEKVLAVATQFDDDGDIDVFFFDTSARYAGTLGLSDYQGGIDRLKKGMMGGTDYADAIDKVVETMFGSGGGGRFRKKAGPSGDKSLPVYVAFLTDGATSDPRRALESGRRSSEKPIFFQSIGLGDKSQFGLLSGDGFPDGNSLNSHGGKLDNFGFFTAPDIARISDDQLLEGLLNEFPGWVKQARSAGLIP